MKRAALSRRTMLRGIGVAVGLPFLDAMSPGFAGAPEELPRLAILYTPNGVSLPEWTAPGSAGITELAAEMPATLRPLTAFRSRCTLISGLRLEPGTDGEPSSAPHCLACTGFLTGRAPRFGEGDLQAGVSIDQRAARMCERDTWLPSIELACEDALFGIDREIGYSTAYLNHLSWRTPYLPLPAETSPAAALSRLFRDTAGGSTGPSRGSMLDGLRSDAGRLASTLGRADRSRLDDHLSSLRDLEERVQKQNELPRGETIRLMIDIVALGLGTGTTRVATLMLGREKSRCTFPEINIKETHHQLSHTFPGEPDNKKLVLIDRYYLDAFAYLVRRLALLETARGSVLDCSALVYGGGMSDGCYHSHDNLPVLVAGGPANRPLAGQQIRLARATSITALHAALLKPFGIGTDQETIF